MKSVLLLSLVPLILFLGCQKEEAESLLLDRSPKEEVPLSNRDQSPDSINKPGPEGKRPRPVLRLLLAYRASPRAPKQQRSFLCQRARSCSLAGFLRPLLGDRPQARCLAIYGGPEVARLRGRWQDQRIDFRFSRRNGCQIERFELLKPFLFAARFRGI